MNHRICRLADRDAMRTPDRLAEVFDIWNRGEPRSYLVEITARVVAFTDDQDIGDVLIDRLTVLPLAGEVAGG